MNPAEQVGEIANQVAANNHSGGGPHMGGGGGGHLNPMQFKGLLRGGGGAGADAAGAGEAAAGGGELAALPELAAGAALLA